MRNDCILFLDDMLQGCCVLQQQYIHKVMTVVEMVSHCAMKHRTAKKVYL